MILQISSHYNPGLPYRLGVVLPGVSTTFDLPRPLTACSKSVVLTKSALNGKQLPLCQTKLTSQHLSLVITPPPNGVGEILVSVDLLPNISFTLSAFCMSPVLRLLPRICVPPGTRSVVPLKVESPFPAALKLAVRSDLVKTKEIALLPDTDTIPLELNGVSKESSLEVTLFFREQKLMTVSSALEIRKLKISIQCKTEGSNASLVLTNLESFPIDVKLSDDSGCLSYSSFISLIEGQTIVKSMKCFVMPPGQPERLVTFRLDLLSPIRVPLPTHCSYRFPSSLVDLRPNLPRFLWLSDEEIEFSMVDHFTNKPEAWKDRVVIQPCPLIEKYVKVSFRKFNRLFAAKFLVTLAL